MDRAHRGPRATRPHRPVAPPGAARPRGRLEERLDAPDGTAVAPLPRRSKPRRAVITDPGVFATTTFLSAALIASAIVHAVGEVRRYRQPAERPDPFVSGRRLFRRLVAAVIVCTLMVAVFAGVNYGDLYLEDRHTFVRYWTACLGMIGFLLLLAFLDLRETRRVATREMRLELERALRLIDQGTDERNRSENDTP